MLMVVHHPHSSGWEGQCGRARLDLRPLKGLDIQAVQSGREIQSVVRAEQKNEPVIPGDTARTRNLPGERLQL